MVTTELRRGNSLLSKLSPETLERLASVLTPCELVSGHVLFTAGEPVEYGYFPAAGICSIMIGPYPGRTVEIGVIGRDGMSGLAPVLGAELSPYHCLVQMAGHGWRITTADLMAEMDTRSELRMWLLRYAHYFMHQVSATAFANASFTVEQRLARWLLLCLDRADGPDLYLTHEFLSIMLGVRRPGVTVATHVLEGERIIRASRGQITVIDREKLEDIAGESYGLAEAEYTRLIGNPRPGGHGMVKALVAAPA